MSDIRGNSRVGYVICLFTDGQHYTAFSETMDPEELSSFLNTYYEAIFEPVRKNAGIISDVKGDSILAIWASLILMQLPEILLAARRWTLLRRSNNSIGLF